MTSILRLNLIVWRGCGSSVQVYYGDGSSPEWVAYAPGHEIVTRPQNPVTERVDRSGLRIDDRASAIRVKLDNVCRPPCVMAVHSPYALFAGTLRGMQHIVAPRPIVCCPTERHSERRLVNPT